MNDPNPNSVDRSMRDYVALEYILLGDLRDVLAEPANKENRRWLIVILDALLETLSRDFELQEQGGYMTEVLEQFPNWYRQVDDLHDEHQALYAKLRGLRERIDQRAAFSRIASELRNDLQDWMHRLVAHHRHEKRILQTAFNLEVGVGD